jgi:Spy/CpxP family protein refolding chaperone
MTGPEHYREGERLLRVAGASEDAPQTCAQLLAEAQVHATLALVAASAMAAASSLPPSDAVGWAGACGTHAGRLKTGAWEEKTDGD